VFDVKGFEARLGEEIEDFDTTGYSNHRELVKDLRELFTERDGYRIFSFEIYSELNPDASQALGEYTVGEIHGVLEDTREGFKLKVRNNPTNDFRIDETPEYEIGVEPASYIDEEVSDLPAVMNPQFL
jgi:hypothetical protein